MIAQKRQNHKRPWRSECVDREAGGDAGLGDRDPVAVEVAGIRSEAEASARYAAQAT
jgi:hypothetical protein